MKEKKGIINKFLYSQKIAPYVFVAPFIITFVLFFAYSMVSMVIMSFQKVSGANSIFIGAENYTKIIKNGVFIKSLKNSLLYMVLSCAIMIPIPMILAIMLNSKPMKAKSTFRSIMFVPALTSVVVAGIIFRLMFGELEGSFMNRLIGVFGQAPIIWLRRPLTVWITLLTLCLWRWTGVNMMYYLSGLQQIPEDLYESADIDGANTWQRLKYITIPLLKPTTVYVLTISIFGGLAMFTESYLIFNGSESPNNVGITIVGLLYRLGLTQNNFGIASAIGVIFLIIVLAINAVQLAINKVGGDE